MCGTASAPHVLLQDEFAKSSQQLNAIALGTHGSMLCLQGLLFWLIADPWALCNAVGARWPLYHAGTKGFQQKVGTVVGSGVYVKIWLACGVEVAEARSRRLCRIGRKAAKEAGNEPLVC